MAVAVAKNCWTVGSEIFLVMAFEMFRLWFSLFQVFLTDQGIPPKKNEKQKKIREEVRFHFSFTDRRLKTQRELDLDNEDFAKLQHFTLPPMNLERPATYKPSTVRPLRRCQSDRAHSKGHTRSRSVGRRDSSQSHVAFSSPIVSTAPGPAPLTYCFCCSWDGKLWESHKSSPTQEGLIHSLREV